MSSFSIVKNQIGKDLEKAEATLDARYSPKAIQEAIDTAKRQLQADAAKLIDDLAALEAKVPKSLTDLYEKGAAVWITDPIDTTQNPLEIRWGMYDLRFSHNGASLGLGHGLYRLIVVGIPMQASELTPYDKDRLRK